jgi:hypothetical protein
MVEKHEVGVFEHVGHRLPRKATALYIWKLVRRPMKLRRMAPITSTAKRLSPAVRAELKFRAAQSLVIALDCAVQAGRDGKPLTTNLFMEALAERWSPIYRQTKRTWGTGRLHDFRGGTVKNIREEIVGQGIAYQKLWKAIRGGVPGLYTTSAPIKDQGRKVTLDEESVLLVLFDRALDNDKRYRRAGGRAPRLLLADDKPPRRKIAQRVAGERPFDIMHIGAAGEETLRRLEAARVFLRVPELYQDIGEAKAKLAAAEWPALKQEWDDILPKLFTDAGLDQIPEPAPRSATAEVKFWATAARSLALRTRKEFRGEAWKAYLTPAREQERNRYRTLKGRLASMQAIQRELRGRGIAGDADVEIKSAFFKHRTRRFQAVNVWPAEASSGEESITPIPPDARAIVREMAELLGAQWSFTPTELATPQRIRWFKVRPLTESPVAGRDLEHTSESTLDLSGLDVSGSQAQILAVVMGLRELEEQLHQTPFKKLVALSIRALQKQGKIRISRNLLANDTMLENVAKGVGMPALYGGQPSNLADKLRRDPERFETGLDTAGVKSLFKHDPTLRQLLAFLPICEAVGHAACEASPTAGVTVEDPLDRVSFTWNPPKRRKVPVASGAFKLYVYEPELHDNDSVVDEAKLVRRIAPGMIHMLDALYAAIVVENLNTLGVRDVVAIHDAFLVPSNAGAELKAAIAGAGHPWLLRLAPFYEFFERYLPASTREGRIVRQWRERWEQRKADCEAGRDTWPQFLTKREGSEFR